MRKLSLVLLVLLLSWGCHKKSASVTVPIAKPVTTPSPESAPPAVTPPVITPAKPAPLAPAPIAKTIMGPSSLDMGEMSFLVGKYAQAAESFEEYLTKNPSSAKRDLALFHLGMSRALAGDSIKDMRQAEAAFKRLIAEFPKSQYRGQAEFILGLHQQIDRMRSDLRERDERIKKLSEELQRLKEIDLQSRPSRPPE